MRPKLKYSIPFSPQSLLIRLTFRYPRPLRQARKSRARKTEEDQIREHLNKLYIHKFMWPDVTHSWVLTSLVSLWGHFQSSLKDHVNWGSLLWVGRNQTSLLSRQARKRIWGTWCGQPQLDLWEGDGPNLPGNNFQTPEGQEGDRDQSGWLYEEEIVVNEPDSLLW